MCQKCYGIIFTDNGIGDGGMQALCDALKNNTTLKKLDLGG